MTTNDVNVRKVAGQYVEPLYLSWYLNNEEIPPPHVENEPPRIPRAGDRLIWGDGTRYAVEEVWQSFEKHGVLSRGYHVFLRAVTSAEDRPHALDPEYYRLE